MYSLKDFKLHIELTDKCNAKCPMCLRTDRDGLEPRSFIRNQELTLSDVEKAFTDVSPTHINICGNVGDPAMATEAYEIVEYFVKAKHAIVTFSTNGSSRNEEWWEKMGRLPNLTVYFGIDGITQHTHEMYRRNTSLQKILNNATAFNLAGGRSVWQWIHFNHNYGDVDNARQLAKRYGFSDFNEINTGWFKKENTFPYTYKQQQHELRPSPLTIKPVFPSEHQLHQCSAVDCFAEAKNEMFISASGDVWPCCIVASYSMESTSQRPNIHTRTLGEVIRGEHFKKFKQQRDQSPSFACKLTCGVRYGNERKQQLLS